MSDPEQNQSEGAPEEYIVTEPPVRELTEEEKVELALKMPCPISKFNGKSLGDVLTLDPNADISSIIEQYQKKQIQNK